MKEFNEQVIKLINLVEEAENNKIKLAASILYNSFVEDGVVHVFATGHSHMFAEDMFYRSGGLVNVDPVLVPALMQHEGAIRSTKLERLPGLAKVIFDAVDKKDGEPFIIVSNSGINSVPVEMAQQAKENNHPVIVVTSLEASSKSKARTIDGKKLYQCADVVIDNHVPIGDGVLEIDNSLTGAVSSIIGSYIAQSIVLEVIKLYKEHHQEPPIYKSANTPGGDEHNKKLYEHYKSRIKSLY